MSTKIISEKKTYTVRGQTKNFLKLSDSLEKKDNTGVNILISLSSFHNQHVVNSSRDCELQLMCWSWIL